MKATSVSLMPALVLVTLVTMATCRTLVRTKRQNYDALLQNKAFVESQLNCVLDRGHCDRIGHRIKILVPEVVQTRECKSCTGDERINVQKVADHVKIHYPKEWNEIKDQYKPEEEEEEEEEMEDGLEEEEEEEHVVSGEDVAVEEEETTEPQREAKELDDNNQRYNDTQTKNNDNNSTTTNYNNSQENKENKQEASGENDHQIVLPRQNNKKKQDGGETSTPN